MRRGIGRVRNANLDCGEMLRVTSERRENGRYIYIHIVCHCCRCIDSKPLLRRLYQCRRRWCMNPVRSESLRASDLSVGMNFLARLIHVGPRRWRKGTCQPQCQSFVRGEKVPHLPHRTENGHTRWTMATSQLLSHPDKSNILCCSHISQY